MNFEQVLRREATSYEQDMEIERILKDQYSQDPFYILGMNTDYFITCQVSEKEIKGVFTNLCIGANLNLMQYFLIRY